MRAAGGFSATTSRTSLFASANHGRQLDCPVPLATRLADAEYEQRTRAHSGPDCSMPNGGTRSSAISRRRTGGRPLGEAPRGGGYGTSARASLVLPPATCTWSSRMRRCATPSRPAAAGDRRSRLRGRPAGSLPPLMRCLARVLRCRSRASGEGGRCSRRSRSLGGWPPASCATAREHRRPRVEPRSTSTRREGRALARCTWSAGGGVVLRPRPWCRQVEGPSRGRPSRVAAAEEAQRSARRGCSVSSSRPRASPPAA